jgi:hypothetical protein
MFSVPSALTNNTTGVSVRSARRLYNMTLVIFGIERSEFSRLRVEAGSNTSTVALRVVGGDEKGT